MRVTCDNLFNYRAIDFLPESAEGQIWSLRKTCELYCEGSKAVTTYINKIKKFAGTPIHAKIKLSNVGACRTMKEYYRIMLGKGSVYAKECRAQGFFGADFDIKQDLSNSLPDDWRAMPQPLLCNVLSGVCERACVSSRDVWE
jgi:hypothetical protein